MPRDTSVPQDPRDSRATYEHYRKTDSVKAEAFKEWAIKKNRWPAQSGGRDAIDPKRIDTATPEERDLSRDLLGAAANFGGMLPGGDALMAGAGAIGPRSLRESTEALRTLQDDTPGMLKRPAQALGLVVSARMNPKFLTVGGKAATGALQGAWAAGQQRFLRPEKESISSRLLATAGNALGGAAGGALLPWAARNPVVRTVGAGAAGAVAGGAAAPEGYGLEGAVAGGLSAAGLAANPSATFNLAAKGLRGIGAERLAKLPSALSQATGTRGIVNTEQEGIDQLAKQVGSMVGAQNVAATLKVAAAKRFEAQSARLYALAVKDGQLLNRPDFMAAVADPDVAPVFKLVADKLAAEGRPLKQMVIGSRNVFTGAFNPAGRPVMRAEKVMGNIPTPESLHITKRLLQETRDKSFAGERVMNVLDAERIEPKLDAIRNMLHAASPAYKKADNAYQLGVVSREAAEDGYNALTAGMAKPTGAKLGVKDVTGLRERATQGTNADPAQARRIQKVMREGQQAGAKAQIAQQLETASPSQGRAGAMAKPIFGDDVASVAQRSLAFGKDAAKNEATITSVRDAANASAVGGTTIPGTWNMKLAQFILKQGSKTPLTSKKAGVLLRQAQDDPEKYQGVLQEFLKGRRFLSAAEQVATSGQGTAFGSLRAFPPARDNK